MARHEPRVQSIKREKKKTLLEKISPKIRFFGNVRERERGVSRKSLSLELKFFM